MKAIVHIKYEPQTGTAQFVVADPETKKCAIIDSVLDYDISTGEFTSKSAKELIEILQQHNYELEWILDTHIHADHVTASSYLKHRFPTAKIGISSVVQDVRRTFAAAYNQNPDDPTPFWDHFFDNNDKFSKSLLKTSFFPLETSSSSFDRF